MTGHARGRPRRTCACPVGSASLACPVRVLKRARDKNRPDAKSCSLAKDIVPAPKIPLHVEVDRAEFVRGFRALQAAEPHERKRATVTFDGSRFSIQLGE